MYILLILHRSTVFEELKVGGRDAIVASIGGKGEVPTQQDVMALLEDQLAA